MADNGELAWPEVGLGELLGTKGYIRGPFGSALRRNELQSSGIPVYEQQHAIDGVREFRYFIDDEKYKELKRFAVHENDLIISCSGTIGRVSVIRKEDPPGIISQALLILRPDVSVATPEFLYYFLTSRVGFRSIASVSSGSVQVNIARRSVVESIRLRLPPLPVQRAIARILGALDDKIELNRKMNETLEAMARAIFKSWFVDFDPVKAKAESRQPSGMDAATAAVFPDSFVESELGLIPRGWAVATLGEVLGTLVSGARPRGGATSEGVPSIGAENVLGLGRYDYSKEKFVPLGFFEQLKAKGADVRPGDVLLYKDGAKVGRKAYFDCGFPHRQCAINEHVFILRATEHRLQRFLFFWLDQPWMTHEIVSLNSNSAQPGINQAGVRGLPILLPETNLIGAFDATVAPLTDAIFANYLESRTLAAIRDALLPKLMSGEIRVGQVGPDRKVKQKWAG